jgi:glucosyl-3-phosphoglycerate synthase
MDFIQEKITTIHDFRIDEMTIISSLEKISKERPMTLLIPMLYKEIHGNTLENITKQINGSTYLHNVVIALAADNEQQYIEVKQFFFPTYHTSSDHMVQRTCRKPGYE